MACKRSVDRDPQGACLVAQNIRPPPPIPLRATQVRRRHSGGSAGSPHRVPPRIESHVCLGLVRQVRTARPGSISGRYVRVHVVPSAYGGRGQFDEAGRPNRGKGRHCPPSPPGLPRSLCLALVLTLNFSPPALSPGVMRHPTGLAEPLVFTTPCLMPAAQASSLAATHTQQLPLPTDDQDGHTPRGSPQWKQPLASEKAARLSGSGGWRLLVVELGAAQGPTGGRLRDLRLRLVGFGSRWLEEFQQPYLAIGERQERVD